MENKGEIILYQNPETGFDIQVRLEQETVWLSQKLMAQLFEKDTDTIGLHIKNIYSENELPEAATTEYFSVVQQEGDRQVGRNIKFYNLDMIISVGYRVNSKRGTQFRQWATQRLKDYLVEGYAINQQRLAQMQRVVEIVETARSSKDLHLDEATGLLHILNRYTRSFVLLNQYDSHSLPQNAAGQTITYEIEYAEARAAIAELKTALIRKKEATDLFGNEKDDSFQGILGAIVQTFGGQYLYPGIEAQAAHLLYFVIKNHPFSDGNKRIGAFLFVWFLEKNKFLLKKSGELKINDNALVAVALMIAQSDPADKEVMTRLVVQLISENYE
jgi:prophage maintenance system killer protein